MVGKRVMDEGSSSTRGSGRRRECERRRGRVEGNVSPGGRIRENVPGMVGQRIDAQGNESGEVSKLQRESDLLSEGGV